LTNFAHTEHHILETSFSKCKNKSPPYHASDRAVLVAYNKLKPVEQQTIFLVVLLLKKNQSTNQMPDDVPEMNVQVTAKVAGECIL